MEESSSVKSQGVLSEKAKRFFIPFIIFSVLIFTSFLIFYSFQVREKASEKTKKGKANKALQQGLSSYEKGDFTKAIASLRETIELNPENAKAYFLLAQSYEAKGELDKAVSEYQRYLKLDPKGYQARYNLAIIYKSQGKKEEAIKELEAAVKANKSFAAAYLDLARLYKESGQIKKAIKNFQILIDLKPFGMNMKQIKKEYEAIKKLKEGD